MDFAEAIVEARKVSTPSGANLIHVLAQRLCVDAAQVVRQLADVLRLPFVDHEALRVAEPRFDVIPYSNCRRLEIIAVAHNDRLMIILSDPYQPDLLDQIEALVEQRFEYGLAMHENVLGYLSAQEESLRALDQAPPPVDLELLELSTGDELSLTAIEQNESPVVRLVSSTLYDALQSRASDVHLEANAGGLTIKYRVDGVLQHVSTLPGVQLSEQIISRVKILAELDISERRIPQDGRFRMSHKKRDIDFRVSVMPSIHGEDAVLRILDKRNLADQMQGLRIEHLGLPTTLMSRLRWLAAEPYGMLLVTGPTGSGKTTTLYALISEVNRGLDKMITIEDPVEYQLPGVLQIPVNEKKGLTFARGLRSILRHDPDRIMVGEIRDPDTAEIAIQSALTGHLVYTTVHANNVVDVIGRLLHMKIDPFSFVSAVNGVLAQRLIRVNCSSCREPHSPPAELLANSRLPQGDGWSFARGRGCPDCRGTGFKGRKAIGELLELDDSLRELIVSRATSKAFKDAAREHGTRFLRDAALDLVRSGETTLEEANRVTFVA